MIPLLQYSSFNFNTCSFAYFSFYIIVLYLSKKNNNFKAAKIISWTIVVVWKLPDYFLTHFSIFSLKFLKFSAFSNKLSSHFWRISPCLLLSIDEQPKPSLLGVICAKIMAKLCLFYFNEICQFSYLTKGLITAHLSWQVFKLFFSLASGYLCLSNQIINLSGIMRVFILIKFEVPIVKLLIYSNLLWIWSLIFWYYFW